MKRLFTILFLVILSTGSAQAACYADYKAKRDDPLRLHYGVAQVDDGACTRQSAANQLQDRLAAQGWTLLNVLSVFDDGGLNERKDSAGQYYLRY